MFEDSIVESKMSTAKKTSTVVVSTAAHALVIGVLLVVPMLVTAALPSTPFSGGIMLDPGSGRFAAGVAADAPAPLKGSAGGSTVTRSAPLTPPQTAVTSEVPVTNDEVPSPTAVEIVETATTPVIEMSTLQVPVRTAARAVPQSMPRIGGGAGEARGVADGLLDGQFGGVQGGSLDGVPGGLVGGQRGGRPGGGLNGDPNGIGAGIGSGGKGPGIGKPEAPPAQRVARAAPNALPLVLPAPPVIVAAPTVSMEPTPPPAKVPIRLTTDVLRAACLKCDPPAYPDLARIVHVSDTVVLSAIVGKDGLVKDVKVVRGHTLLQPAAIDAVNKWRYKPQKLNGEPVEVTATISIAFVFEK